MMHHLPLNPWANDIKSDEQFMSPMQLVYTKN